MISKQDLAGEKYCQIAILSWLVVTIKDKKVPTFGNLFTMQEEIGTLLISWKTSPKLWHFKSC